MNPTCDHPTFEIIHGDCNLCYGGREYCPDCGYESQTHESHCPEDAQCPRPLAIRYWKDIPYRLRTIGASAPQTFGVTLAQLRGGFYAVYAADEGLTEEGSAWIEYPYTFAKENHYA